MAWARARLAFEAGDRNAWRFQGGVTYVRAPETGLTAKDALADCARGLQLQLGDEPERTLRDYVNNAPCLLFDNMERAGMIEVNKLAEFVASLNMDAGSKVLFTLRPPLSDRFGDVREINLHAGLDEDSAIEYARFIARNENAAREWQNLDEAKALVDRVKGHPELIRLTVNRSKRIPFAQVKNELASLSGKLDEALQEMIGKQVNDAGELAKTALMRLTIFPQPRIIAEAASAACGDAVAGLEALVEHGVIAFEAEDVQRYALHPTVIDWVKRHPVSASLQGRFAGAGEQGASLQEAKQRAVAKYVNFVKANWRNNNLLADEHDNLIASLDWAWSMQTWQESSDLCNYIFNYLRLRGYWDVANQWMKRGIEATKNLPTTKDQQARLAALNDHLARTYSDRGDYDDALAAYQESLNLYRQVEDESSQATISHQMAIILVTRGDLNGAMQLYAQALDTFERLGDLQGKAATLHQMAGVLATRGDLTGAMALYQQSLDMKERLGDLKGKTATLHQMAGVLVTRGDLNGAMALYAQALDTFERLGDLQGKAATLHQMAGVLVTRGDLTGAMALHEQSLDTSERLGDLKGKAATLSQMSNVLVGQNIWAEAKELVLRSLEVAGQLQDPYWLGLNTTKLGQIAEHDMNLDEAAKLYRESIGYFEKLGSPVAEQVKGMLAKVERMMKGG